MTTILDHIDNIAVPGDPFAEPANEYWALICFREGMNYLYAQAKRIDDGVRKRMNPHGNIRFEGVGNCPDFDGVPKALLTCAFHWYAISVCQYVRTIGAIASRLDPNRIPPRHYVDRVIPEVAVFRDKVAAHLAWTTKNQHDNDAERLASSLPPLVFMDDSFHVGAYEVTLSSPERTCSSSEITRWSICKVHERLAPRYWPNDGGQAK